jgi:hypothetical protein
MNEIAGAEDYQRALLESEKRNGEMASGLLIAAEEIKRLQRELADCEGWRMRVHDELIARRIMRPEHLGAPFKGVSDLIEAVKREGC